MQSAQNNPVTSSADETQKFQNEILDHENITYEFIESLKPKVRVVDNDDNLKLYCYSTCEENDENIVKFCRGLVFDENNKLFLKAYSYTPEYTTEQVDMFKTSLEDNWSQCRFFDAYEGTVIRVFFYMDKWYISTHRRLDAFKSKWASQSSFGDLFLDGLIEMTQLHPSFLEFVGQPDGGETFSQRFLSKLNQNHQYFFLVRASGENRIVCDVPKDGLVLHIATFDVNTKQEIQENIGLPFPQERHFDNVDDLVEFVSQVSYHDIQGIVAFTPQHQIKILNPDYKYYFDLRGNEPSIKFRYLQIRMDREKRMDYMDMYSTHMAVFDSYEDVLYETAQKIKEAYVKRFISKEFVRVPPEDFAVMKECHSWYRKDRKNNHITLQRVIDILNNQPANRLNKIIRRSINEKRKAEFEKASEPTEETTQQEEPVVDNGF